FSNISMPSVSATVLSLYTLARTQTASARARIDTQAPCCMKRSAIAACRESSRAIILTMTFESAAPMPLPNVLSNSVLQLLKSSSLRRSFREQRPMDVHGRILARATDNDLIAVLVPFQDRTRADSKFAANL